MTPLRYVHTVIETLPFPLQQRSLTSIQNRDEAEAGLILAELNENRFSTGQLRYRFPLASNRDQLIKAIFDRAITHAPEQVLQTSRSTAYPLYKRVIWIDAPQVLRRILNNQFIRVAILVAVIYASISIGYIAYEGIRHYTTARALPFIINHTSLQIIDLFNKTMTALEKIMARPWTILGLAYAGRIVILRGPPIPYLTELVRAINPLDIFLIIIRAPQSIGVFLWSHSILMALSGKESYQQALLFLKDIEEKAKAEQLAYTKQHAYAFWVQSLNEMHRVGD